MKKIKLNEDWIPAYYCKIHKCYDCQLCEKVEHYKTPSMRDDRLMLTTTATLKWYQKRIQELEKELILKSISQAKDHTARDAHNLAQSMWAQKLGTEDCFDFVRRLLNKLYKLSVNKEEK